ncbi:hypothetical protein DQM68_08125 [Leptospira mayottensis]|uniref:Uncharacterized protein n=2 Tax=Leptospira mayottensis TaxID=1137606 RepID=A0AA87MJW9_9LEPT|nr:hypothetical protein DQM68_08125 [Leptospira mayottensis]AXR64470.1 hypothetical protein DQM28_09805 [Leptospira mayottensis]AZQ02912.1 hypothetical protein LEP1GSC190_13560 [Leptospira mayottensis 200901116]EKR98581.1 hypothetical protein LEP1GSC125_1786 [Leptospira mayottensis 200901122]TGM95676.1 hypothetical protein EHR03_16365 [Leptospira mayottensis]
MSTIEVPKSVLEFSKEPIYNYLANSEQNAVVPTIKSHWIVHEFSNRLSRYPISIGIKSFWAETPI